MSIEILKKYIDPSVFEELKQKEKAAEYLNDALAYGDPGVFVHVLNNLLEIRGVTYREVSTYVGAGYDKTCKMLNGDKEPTWHFIKKVCDLLDMPIVIAYL